MKLLKTYYPSPKFPPISLSGDRCQLHCRHCDAAYLKGMRPAQTPEAFLETCRTLERGGAIGALLSGGSDKEGRILNLRASLDAIRQAKCETNLLFNLHPGLLAPETAHALAVDFVSFELPATHVIREIFGLQANVLDYVKTYRRLREAGHEVVPHICVYEGDEHLLLDYLDDVPDVVVVIVFAPTRHTPMENIPPPTPQRVGQVIQGICAMFPEAEIALGCMRPKENRWRARFERVALDAGVSRMVMPSSETLRYAQAHNYTIQRYDACCALPVKHERLAIHR